MLLLTTEPDAVFAVAIDVREEVPGRDLPWNPRSQLGGTLPTLRSLPRRTRAGLPDFVQRSTSRLHRWSV